MIQNVNKSPNLIVRINGEDIHNTDIGLYNILEISIVNRFVKEASIFDFTITDDDLTMVSVNDRIEIKFDDTYIMKGIVDTTSHMLSSTSNTVKISGRDLTGWYISNHALPKKYGNTSDNGIIEDINSQAEDLGFGFFNTGFATKNYAPKKAVLDYNVTVGQSMFDVMTQVASLNNYYLYFSPDGTLLKTSLADLNNSEFTPLEISEEIYPDSEVNINRSILNAKSDIYIYGSVSNSSNKNIISDLLTFKTNPISVASLLDTSKKSRKSKSLIEKRGEQRPDGLNTNNIFRNEGTNLEFDRNRLGSTFRRRKVLTHSNRKKEEIDQIFKNELEDTAPTFDVDFTIKKLVNISMNTFINLNFRYLKGIFLVRAVEYYWSPSVEKTTLRLNLPNRI